MKTKIKIVMTIILLSFFNISDAGWNTTSEIQQKTNYSKQEGIHTLKLKQQKFTNPFAGKTIIQQFVNGISSGYYVDGVFYSFTAPNQKVLSWDYKNKVYRYDISKPTCQGVSLFENGDISKNIALGDWTNKNIKARISCYDSVSGCKKNYSEMLNVGYKTIPQTTFEDNARNFNTCQGNLNGKIILIDKILPKIKSIQIGGKSLSLLNEDSGTNILADDKYKNIVFSLEDLGNTTNGISGIKSYNFKIIYKKNYKGGLINSEICSDSKNYNIFNPIIDGKVKEISDKKNITVTCSGTYPDGNYKITKAGEYELSLVIKDFAGNIKTLKRKINIYPNYLNTIKSSISVNSNGDKFANLLDYYTYTLSLKDKYSNPIYNKYAIITHNGVKIIKTNSINNTGDNALVFNLNKYKTNIDGKIYLTIKSLSPGVFSQSFSIDMKKWNSSYINISENQIITKSILENNSFKKPISGEFEGNVEVGKDKDFKIKLKDNGNLGTLINGKLDINKNTIVDSNGFVWNKFLLNNSNSISNISNSSFDITGNIDGLLESPKIESRNLGISYKLGGKNIKYYLDKFDMASLICNYETLGLKVIGTLQGEGKSDITGQKSNFSDLSKGKIRGDIRKNAYKSIKNRNSNKNLNVNGVIYVEGDIKYSEVKNILKENDTIIVKNGNFEINQDINKNIGIIVLNDNYNVKYDYNKKGNIYVANDVDIINAIIYSDGAFRSSKSSGLPYSDTQLENKLELYGSLFTRNTIGGAVIFDSSYTLPGGEEVSDYDLAEVYDLNYIRKVPKSCDGDDSNDYSFIIKYNPNINSNPPKLFDTK